LNRPQQIQHVGVDSIRVPGGETAPQTLVGTEMSAIGRRKACSVAILTRPDSQLGKPPIEHYRRRKAVPERSTGKVLLERRWMRASSTCPKSTIKRRIPSIVPTSFWSNRWKFLVLKWRPRISKVWTLGQQSGYP